MLDEKAFDELVSEIVAQGSYPDGAPIDEATAVQYAIWIGDRPIVDEAGNVIVLDGKGHEVAKLRPLKMFAD